MTRACFLVAFLSAAIAAPQLAHADRVTCVDGTTSESGRGACSHHGGVAKTRAKKSAPRKTETTHRETTQTRREKTTQREPAPVPSIIVRCADGSTSWAIGRGACSHHGGVADARQRDTRTQPREPRTQAREPRTQERESRTQRSETRKDDTPWWKPRDEHEPGKPMARCRDGSISYSTHHQGTCGHHGGVADWLDD